jgi:hypothetical protein
MSEKIPTGGNQEEQIDQSKRNFLKGLAGVGAAAAIGGAVLSQYSEEEKKVEGESVENPHDTLIESLGREETMKEIVHNERRIVQLQNLLKYGEGVETDAIEYFLKETGDARNEEALLGEVQKLKDRSTLLRARRDALSKK